MATNHPQQNDRADRVHPYLSVQITYTTQPFGSSGPPDYELVTNALTYYQTSLVKSLDNCLDKAQKFELVQSKGLYLRFS